MSVKLRALKEDEGHFRGSEPFFEYLSRGLKPGQAIRIYNYGTLAPNEPHFVLGLEGKLYDCRSEVEVDPASVLGEEDTWCFEGYRIIDLPDDVAVAVLDAIDESESQ